MHKYSWSNVSRSKIRLFTPSLCCQLQCGNNLLVPMKGEWKLPGRKVYYKPAWDSTYFFPYYQGQWFSILPQSQTIGNSFMQSMLNQKILLKLAKMKPNRSPILTNIKVYNSQKNRTQFLNQTTDTAKTSDSESLKIKE